MIVFKFIFLKIHNLSKFTFFEIHSGRKSHFLKFKLLSKITLCQIHFITKFTFFKIHVSWNSHLSKLTFFKTRNFFFWNSNCSSKFLFFKIPYLKVTYVIFFFRYWTSFLRSPLGHFISVSSGGHHVTNSIRHQVFSGLFHLTNDLLSRSRFHDDHVCYSNSKNLEFSNLKKSFTFFIFSGDFQRHSFGQHYGQ